MEYLFRDGTVNDQAALQELGLNAYGQFKNILTEVNWKKLHMGLSNENRYSDLLSTAKCFVCEYNNDIVAMAFVVPSGNATEIFQSDWAYLRMVGVHTDFGGKGIGKKLTQMCLDYARKNGEKTMALHTSEFMDAARYIYESVGFKRLREINPIFGKRYWLYTLDL